MNKKFIIILVLVLVILLIPIPIKMKDGGSTEYRAALYTLTKYHKLDINNTNGYVEGTEIKILGFRVYNNLPKENIQNKEENNIVSFGLVPSKNNVDSFILMLDENKSKEKWYNVTTNDISENYNIEIFKSQDTCESYLVYENEKHQLGEYFGGIGITSFAITDINKDKNFELFFTYSWGSGMHRSMVGYFDSTNKKVIIFDLQHLDNDIMIEKTQEGALGIYEMSEKITSAVDIIPKKKNNKKVAEIIYKGNSIILEKIAN